MSEAPAEDQPPQGEGTSRTRRSGKEPTHIGSSEKASSTVSSSSHGGGDGGGDSGTSGISEYYQHDEDDVVPVEEVHELPPSGRYHGYQRRRRDSPPGAGGSNEQGNMSGDVGGQQAASWTDSWNPNYSGQRPSEYFSYSQVQQGEERSSASGSYSYGDYGETQYGRYPPPPSSKFLQCSFLLWICGSQCSSYQIQYGANRNDDIDGDEDNHGALNLGRHSFWW